MRQLLFLLLAGVAFSAEIQFNRDVRPILSDKCFACHGPDAKTKGIALRLDSEEAAKRAIVPGNIDGSRLVKRITAAVPAMRMPPVASGVSLTAGEIETLRAWIGQGAKWEAHWSFIPPVKKAGTIDSFVRARLAKEGLQPSPAATPETLIRRATIDLTGLPPTPKEVDAFLKDGSYEKLLDRLLASPRFGERMAARWLDAARYADTNGYQYDGERVMWRWRDYVIESFNKNKPFDKFVVEQIAGDMLPGATFEQKLATAFNRNHRGNTEDGIVAEEYAVEYVVDRIETTSAVFMGLTMGCTRCHNHKYDPLTQKEFYQMFAYFNNIPERGRAMKYGNSPPLMAAPTEAQQKKLAALNAEIRALEAKVKPDSAGRRAWEKTLTGAAGWSPYGERDAVMAFDDGGAAGRIGGAKLFDGNTVVPGPAKSAQFDIEDRFTMAAWVNGSGTIAARKSNDGFQSKGIGLFVEEGKVRFHISSQWESDALKVETEGTLGEGWHHVAVAYGGTRMAEDALIYVDGVLQKTKFVSDTLYRPFVNAGGKFNASLTVGGGAGKEKRFRGLLDDVRVYGRQLRPDEIAMMAAGRTLVELAGRKRTELEERQLHLAYLETNEVWRRAGDLRIERERFERTFPSVMIMAEAPERKKTHLLVRGAYDKPGEEVQPGLPAILPPLPEGAPNNRLGFAQWLVDRRNPLTARVTVNRFWQSIFGTGLVKTAEDFGQQGEWPSHPELLDWLAVDFIENGWDVKALLKKIMLSETYRQSSKATPALLAKDPDNRLLARGPRIRMAAEMVRDAALYEAGLLHEQLGGPSVKPYQPDGLWKEVIMQDFDYVQAKGPDLYRRSLYTFWKRTAAPPMMMNFDASQREACMVRENRTNTPLQALNLMNDVTFLEAARFIGQRMMLEGGAGREERLRHGFRIVTGRAPSEKELGVLRASLAYHLDYFASHAQEREEYLSHGDTEASKAVDRGELAAYAAVASLLMNTDEAITKE
ncbi:MAG: DUF1553 domain-containing protein [Bryobacterales bacterium]|nr:DUF1553 domain-containing protein [Bryobacterales bacterium]